MFHWFFTYLALISSCALASNSSFTNPILPGFHPDPSCTFVPEWENTTFCVSSTFQVFPGMPIHASRDLQQWKLIGNALSRPQQLPSLATTNGSTSGIWAPTLRYHHGTFYISTTMVHDHLAYLDLNRWDNFVIQSDDPYNSSSWSDPVHFKFPGYDTSLFWDDDNDGQVYVSGAQFYVPFAGMVQYPINLNTGEVGEQTNPWNGTGGLAPEGPHMYKKDGYYYVLLAEGGTGPNHMVTMARSKQINGPYEAYEHNPVLTNVNTTAYFQAVGHADLFHDASGQWWAVALSVRAGPEFTLFPMGRETVMIPVRWDEGDWPVFTQVSGHVNSWPVGPAVTIDEGEGQLVNGFDFIDFSPGSTLPPHFEHWRIPVAQNYIVSPEQHPNTLQLRSSIQNLTGYDGQYVGHEGQTFVGRRQTDTFFSYSVDLDISGLQKSNDEAGVSLFVAQPYHFDLGIVMLPAAQTKPGQQYNSTAIPHLRFGGISNHTVYEQSYPLPESWLQANVSQPQLQAPPSLITFAIKAFTTTHYVFSAGPTARQSEMQTFGYCLGEQVTFGYTGTMVGVYATTNGEPEPFNAYFANWRYEGHGQVVD